MDAVTEKGDPRTSKKAIDKASDKSGRVDSIVTARVPTEIKKQGNAVLEKIGATPTELINSAYEYAISHGSLPTRVRSCLCPSKASLPRGRGEARN